MHDLNEVRPLRRLGVTRRRLLEEIDRPALKLLPTTAYEFAEWKTCRVGIDYHVEGASHYYSVPHRFLRAEVEARLTTRSPRGCGSPNYASRPASKTSVTAPRAASTGRSFRSWSRADGSTPTIIWP